MNHCSTSPHSGRWQALMSPKIVTCTQCSVHSFDKPSVSEQPAQPLCYDSSCDDALTGDDLFSTKVDGDCSLGEYFREFEVPITTSSLKRISTVVPATLPDKHHRARRPVSKWLGCLVTNLRVVTRASKRRLTSRDCAVLPQRRRRRSFH